MVEWKLTQESEVQAYKAYATERVVAAAFAAYQQNGGTIRKWSADEQGLMSNATLMKNQLQSDEFTEAELEQAREAIRSIQTSFTFKNLKGSGLNRFENTIRNKIQEYTVPANSLNILAYVPMIYNSMITKQEQKARAYPYEINSKHIPEEEGQKIEFDLTVLELIRSSPNVVPAYTKVYGHTESGYLVMFYTNKPELTVNGRYSGKVKEKIQISHRNNAQVTTLNYVRKVKEKSEGT